MLVLQPSVLASLTCSGVLLLPASAASALDADLECHTDKLKTAAKYGVCRLRAESKAVKVGGVPDFASCQQKFSRQWQSIEAKAGSGVCPSEDAAADIAQRMTDDADEIAFLLAGGSVGECGNDLVEGLEQCDGTDDAACPAGCLPSCTCGLLFPATGQTTWFGSGDDGDFQAGAPLAYSDNGDGTISDLNTGLMWEKKVALDASVENCTTEAGSCANPHDAENAYAWTAGSTAYDGSVVTIFLEQLNDRCNADTTVACSSDGDCSGVGGACGFGGYPDWRLPNIKELQSIVNYQNGSPAVSAAFNGASCGPACTDISDPACSCTFSSGYWSSTTFAGFAGAWVVTFGGGDVSTGPKPGYFFARAVRGGS